VIGRNELRTFVIIGALVLSATSSMADSGSDRRIIPDSSWSVRADTTLQSTLRSWTAREGWDLIWDAKNDYRIRASAQLGGDFLSAVRALADAVNMTSPDLTVTLYLGNRVIHVRDTNLTNN
jgi:hypothetical protein